MDKESIGKGYPCLLNLLPGLQPVPYSACQQEEVEPRERWSPLLGMKFQAYPQTSGSIEQNTISRTELAFDLHIQYI